MTREEKIAILKDIIDGEIIHPQVRKDVGIWAIKSLEQEPTGRWIETHAGAMTFWQCSVCGCDSSSFGNYRFCPGCGCKMEVKND